MSRTDGKKDFRLLAWLLLVLVVAVLVFAGNKILALSKRTAESGGDSRAPATRSERANDEEAVEIRMSRAAQKETIPVEYGASGAADVKARRSLEHARDRLAQILTRDPLEPEDAARVRESLGSVFGSDEYERSQKIELARYLMMVLNEKPASMRLLQETLVRLKPVELTQELINALHAGQNENVYGATLYTLLEAYSTYQNQETNPASGGVDRPSSLLSLIPGHGSQAQNPVSHGLAFMRLGPADQVGRRLQERITGARHDMDATESAVSMFADTLLARKPDQAGFLETTFERFDSMDEFARHALLLKLNQVVLYEKAALSEQASSAIMNFLDDHRFRLNRQALEQLTFAGRRRR